MPIIISERTAKRGEKDAKRHRDKQRELIKKQLPRIISEESIITRKHGKTVKVPIKLLDIPKFKHGSAKKGGAGIGQGEGSPGDIIGRQRGKGKGPGGKKAGNEPGVDYIETEIDMEEILEMMFEDLGLPRLDEKTVKMLVVELGLRLHGTTRSGPEALLNAGKTAQEGMQRFWHLLRELERQTGKSERVCYVALKQAKGIFGDARTLVNSGTIDEAEAEKIAVKAFVIMHPDDMRYHKQEEKITEQSQAVVFAMRDVSYSMNDEKKYLSRSLLYWLVNFLQHIYKEVVILFLAHHTTARFVTEEEFFYTGESGGTLCYSPYELASGRIDAEFPQSQWNIYTWHFTDGDDFDPARTVREVKKICEKGISMAGYGEVRTEGDNTVSELMNAFSKEFGLVKQIEDNLHTFESRDDRYPFLGIIIRQRKDILPALKAFLKQERWTS